MPDKLVMIGEYALMRKVISKDSFLNVWPLSQTLSVLSTRAVALILIVIAGVISQVQMKSHSDHSFTTHVDPVVVGRRELSRSATNFLLINPR